MTDDLEFFNIINSAHPNVICYSDPDQELSVCEAEESDLINCILLSTSTVVVGTGSLLLKVASQFNPVMPVEECEPLWLEKRQTLFPACL